MNDPLVSVLMPVRNEEDAVEAALRSVLGQTLSALEVLVIDGRSDDGTRAVVTRVATEDARVRLLDNPARTIPAGLNVGLAHARGAFVARVDGHSTITADYLETGLAVLRHDHSLGAVGGRRQASAQSKTGRAVAAAVSSPYGIGNSINHYGGAAQETDHASWGIYRSEVLSALAGWDTGLLVNEDVDLDFRLLRAGYRIWYEPRMLVRWQVRERLNDLARQYRRYGRGKAAMVRKNGVSAIRARHLAPPALVLCLATATGLAVANRIRTAAAMITPYPLALLVAARRTGHDPDVPPALVAAALAAVHLGWGVGFLEGTLLRLPPAASTARPTRRRRPSERQLSDA